MGFILIKYGIFYCSVRNKFWNQSHWSKIFRTEQSFFLCLIVNLSDRFSKQSVRINCGLAALRTLILWLYCLSHKFQIPLLTYISNALCMNSNLKLYLRSRHSLVLWLECWFHRARSQKSLICHLYWRCRVQAPGSLWVHIRLALSYPVSHWMSRGLLTRIHGETHPRMLLHPAHPVDITYITKINFSTVFIMIGRNIVDLNAWVHENYCLLNRCFYFTLGRPSFKKVIICVMQIEKCTRLLP